MYLKYNAYNYNLDIFSASRLSRLSSICVGLNFLSRNLHEDINFQHASATDGQTAVGSTSNCTRRPAAVESAWTARATATGHTARTASPTTTSPTRQGQTEFDALVELTFHNCEFKFSSSIVISYLTRKSNWEENSETQKNIEPGPRRTREDALRAVQLRPDRLQVTAVRPRRPVRLQARRHRAKVRHVRAHSLGLHGARLQGLRLPPRG